MTTELALIEDPEARRTQIDRTDVLDQIKAIAQLPADAVVSYGYAASIFGVKVDTVKKAVDYHLGEYVDDDAMGFGEIVSLKGGRPATRGLNRRGLLLLGMMLRDSEVAKQVRRLLLQAFEVAEAAVTDVRALVAETVRDMLPDLARELAALMQAPMRATQAPTAGGSQVQAQAVGSYTQNGPRGRTYPWFLSFLASDTLAAGDLVIGRRHGGKEEIKRLVARHGTMGNFWTFENV